MHHVGVAEKCDKRVCLSIICEHYQRPIFKFLCMLPIAVAQFYFGGVAIGYVLPVY